MDFTFQAVPFIQESREEFLASFPKRSGVYKVFDTHGKLIVLDKTSNLHERMERFFGERSEMLRDLDLREISSRVERGGVTDTIVRLTTDTLWSGSEKIRNWRGGDVRRIYYLILGMYVVWGCLAMGLAQPMVLLMIGANIAAFIFAFTGIHVIIVNRKILPKEVRAPLWREAVVVCCSIFYAVSFTLCMGKACHLF